MIPSGAEIAYAIYGALRLARLDRGGMAFFDSSLDGFWKSFFAAVIIAPGYVLLLMIELADVEFTAGPLRIVVVETLTYVIAWVSFPLVMYYLAENIGRSSEYRGFVVAYNWAQVVQLVVFLPVKGIVVLDFLPGPLQFLLNLGVIVAILGYQWFIARTALKLNGAAATGVVVLAFIIDVIINGFGHAMIR